MFSLRKASAGGAVSSNTGTGAAALEVVGCCTSTVGCCTSTFPHPGVEPKWCTQVNSLVACYIYTDQSQLHVAVSCHRPPSQNPHQSFFHLR
jgi:hypothetical protein